MAKRYNIAAVAFISLVCIIPLAYAQCPSGKIVRLTLTSSEFEIPGYDADKGILAVRPTQNLLPNKLRKRAVRLLLDARDIFMSVGPASLRIGLERSALLELHLEGEPVQPVTKLGMKPDCDRLVVKRASLRHDGMLLAHRRLDTKIVPKTTVAATIQLERGGINKEKLAAFARTLAKRCLTQHALRTQRLRGALSIQLETSVLGQRGRPKIVVDGLVNPTMSSCLLMSLHEEESVWATAEPATRVYLNYFFRDFGEPKVGY